MDDVLRWVLIFVPVVTVVGCIKVLGSASYGFLLTAALTLCLLPLVGVEPPGLGDLFMQAFTPGLLEVTLMVTGLAMLSTGIARSFAPAMIGRIQSPGLRSLAIAVFAIFAAFADTTAACELAIQSSAPGVRKRPESLLLFAGVSNMGALLFPFSPAWTFYKGLLGGAGLSIRPEAMWVPAATFVLSLLAMVVWRHLRDFALMKKSDPAVLLRLPLPRPHWKEVVLWAAFIGPLATLPIYGSRVEHAEHYLFYGILAGLTLYFGGCLLLDVSSAVQPALETPTGHGKRSLVNWPNAHLLTIHPHGDLSDLQTAHYVTLPEPAGYGWRRPSWRTLFDPRAYPRLAFRWHRLKASWHSRTELMESAIRAGALVGLLAFSAGIFRATLSLWSKAVNPPYDNLQNPLIQGALILLVIAAVSVGALYLGDQLGTGWGTYAILLALVAPIMAKLSDVHVSAIAGILVAATAAANTLSERSDNIQTIGHALHLDRATIAKEIRRPAQLAVACSMVAALVVAVAFK